MLNIAGLPQRQKRIDQCSAKAKEVRGGGYRDESERARGGIHRGQLQKCCEVRISAVVVLYTKMSQIRRYLVFVNHKSYPYDQRTLAFSIFFELPDSVF